MAPKKRGGGGNLSRRAALTLLSGGGLLAIGGSGAFDSVKGHRGFDVSTAADPSEALLGIDELTDRFSALLPSGDGSSDRFTLLELINNSSQTLTDITISQETAGNADDQLKIVTPDEIKPDEAKEIEAEITHSGTNTITLTITASSTSDSASGITVETTREVEVTGYRMTVCPRNALTREIDSNYISSGDLTIVNERVLGNVEAGGVAEIKAKGNGGTCFIDGSVRADGDGESKIRGEANGSKVYITGDINATSPDGDGGDLLVKGKDITIAGDVTVGGTLTIHPTGRQSSIVICGEVTAGKRKRKGNKHADVRI